jgi:hypothetical protein
MLVGVVASNVLRVVDHSETRALGVLFIGYFFQGIGFFMTMFFICIYILRCVSTLHEGPPILIEYLDLSQDYDGMPTNPATIPQRKS